MSNRTNLNSFRNLNYFHGKSKVIRLFWILISRIFFQTQIPYPSKFKCLLLKAFGAKIGRSIIIKPNLIIKHPWMLEIGDYSWIGENVWIDNLAFVRIGKNVCLSQGAFLLTGNHNYKKTSFDLITGEIILEDGVWIGAKAVICPNIKCYSHSILTVGSVASENLKEYTIYQGNPAQPIRERIIV